MGHQLLCHGLQNAVSLSPGADGGWGSYTIAANLAKDQKKLFCLLRHTPKEGRELLPICYQIRNQE